MAPRPHKERRVRGNPNATYFKPSGIPTRDLEKIHLFLSEFEAIRLKDYEQLDQQTCAEEMQISQPTFHRLLLSARRKVGDALINGKAIAIEELVQREKE
jgi:uncharacterized protein